MANYDVIEESGVLLNDICAIGQHTRDADPYLCLFRCVNRNRAKRECKLLSRHQGEMDSPSKTTTVSCLPILLAISIRR